MLHSNLKYLREKKNLSQERIAELLAVSRATYSNYEKQQSSEPSASKLLKLATFYKVDVDALLKQNLSINLFNPKPENVDNILSKETRILPVTVSDNQKYNVEFVATKAVAGYVESISDVEYVADLPRIHIPNLPYGQHRAFEIQGDSMPPIRDGFIVIGKYLERASDLQNGKRYVLVLRNGEVLFKKVVSELDKQKKLILVSDNSEYQPYSVAAKDVLQAWEFVAYIGFPTKRDMDYLVLDKLHQIEQKIDLIATNTKR